jgi:hypothetical protein
MRRRFRRNIAHTSCHRRRKITHTGCKRNRDSFRYSQGERDGIAAGDKIVAIVVTIIAAAKLIAVVVEVLRREGVDVKRRDDAGDARAHGAKWIDDSNDRQRRRRARNSGLTERRPSRRYGRK